MDADVNFNPDFGMPIPKCDPSEFKKAMLEQGSSPKQLYNVERSKVDDSGYRSFDHSESSLDSVRKKLDGTQTLEDEDVCEAEDRG